MAAIHMFFPMTYGNPDDGRPVPTFESSIPIFEDFKRVVNHPPRTSTMRIRIELCFRFFVCFAHYDHRPHVSNYARVLRRWYVIIELGFYFFVFSDAFRLSGSTIVSKFYVQ